MSATHNEFVTDGVNPNDLESGKTEGLRELHSAQSITMTPELFEKLYLSPPNKVEGNLRLMTPRALVGFLLSLMPLACDLMGWRGARDFGVAQISVYFFMGGLLMFLSGIFEWVLGNSFPATVFCSFGGFWFSFGGILNPSFGAYSFYATDPQKPTTGLANAKFNASLGFWLVVMGVLAFVYLICALRTNIVFVTIFLSLLPAFSMLTAAFWLQAEDFEGNAAKANQMFVVSCL
uniref:Protein alcS n=1 Tax=Bionectria ochroleuca TaxID=29856 RepID=A0A8H7KCH5_BIOOC